MAVEFESNVVIVGIIFWHAFNRDWKTYGVGM